MENEGILIVRSVMSKNTLQFKERIPPEWFWKDHRIPRQLQDIEDGYSALDYYIMAWLVYVIPNFWDFIRYYGREDDGRKGVCVLQGCC